MLFSTLHIRMAYPLHECREVILHVFISMKPYRLIEQTLQVVSVCLIYFTMKSLEFAIPATDRDQC